MSWQQGVAVRARKVPTASRMALGTLCGTSMDLGVSGDITVQGGLAQR